MKEPPSRSVSLRGLAREAPIPRARLKRLLLEVMAAERAPSGTLHVEFVTDEVMRRVNAGYRGKDATTDVLSFAYWNEPHAGDRLGEVLVSLAVARRQARAQAVPLAEEVARLALHGVLHVLGYDHETSRDYDRMIGLQERYLRALWPADAARASRSAAPRSTARPRAAASTRKGSAVRC